MCMSVRQSSTTAFRISGPELTSAECTDARCEFAAAATGPGAVTALALAGVLALLAFAYIRDARTECRNERRRVLDERDAFERFAERVADVDPVPVETRRGPPERVERGLNAGARPDGGDAALRRVLSAYRDTVMALPHYRSEYDETVAESLSAELGPDTTTALASDGTLSPGAQSALVRRSRRAVDAREELADAVAGEVERLTEAESALADVDRRRRRLVGHLDGMKSGPAVDAAIDVWRRLGELERDCDDLAADRQRELDDPPMTLGETVTDEGDRAFYAYLYGATDGPRYPVLAQSASLADRVREDRSRVGSRVAGGH